jgi:putative serine/threonine protein kinase
MAGQSGKKDETNAQGYPNISRLKSIPGISDIEYLDSGQRGVIYIARYEDEEQGISPLKVIIKVPNPESKAINRIRNEAAWLEKLEKHRIGPGIVTATDDYLIERFIDGPTMVEFLKSEGCDREDALYIIRDVLKQCFAMDMIGISKEEMHRPIKHIIIELDDAHAPRPIMIDFERTHHTEKPKNVTQFCQFLAWSDITDVLAEKGIIIDKTVFQQSAMEYKKNISEDGFDKIIGLIVD